MFFPASVVPVLLGTAWGVRVAGELDAAAFALALAATRVRSCCGQRHQRRLRRYLRHRSHQHRARLSLHRRVAFHSERHHGSQRHAAPWGFSCSRWPASSGLRLAALKGAVVIALGLSGAALGVVYSATPLQLSARGLGELAVGIGFGVLPVMGAAWLQSGTFGLDSLLISLPLSCWVLNILLINEIPDIEADAAVGKRTLPVRLGLKRHVAPLSRDQHAGLACRRDCRCPGPSADSCHCAAWPARPGRASTSPSRWRVPLPRVRPSPRRSRRHSPFTRLAVCG